MKMSKVSKTVIYILLGLVAIYFLSPFIYICCFLHLRQKQKQLRSHRNYFRQNGDSKILRMPGIHSLLADISSILFWLR